MPVIAVADSLTYNGDIAPIIDRHCVECHRPGEVAPFSLTKYQDVRKRAMMLKEVMASGYMPPWPPDTGFVSYLDERSVSKDDVGLLDQWIQAGMPEGDPSRRPELPEFPGGWKMGVPDLVVTLESDILVPSEGGDIYRSFVAPLEIERQRYVRAVEFRPGSASQVIHHATLVADTVGAARRYDAMDPLPGFAGSAAGVNPGGHFIGWAPGATPRPFGKDMAWSVEPGTDLVLQLHLFPTGKEEKVRPLIGIYFTDQPPKYEPSNIRLGVTTLDIGPGNSDYRITDEFTVPVDVTAFSIYPHAHYLCTQIEATAFLPNGDRVPLIRISDWDFDWQGEYTFANPIDFPAQTTIKVEFRYDNSSGNTDNPHSPPTRSRWGPRSTDEMGELWIKAITKLPSERQALEQAIEAGYVKGMTAGFHQRLEEFPNDLEANSRIGSFLIAGGKAREAIPYLTRALERASVRWSILNDIGIAKTHMGALDEAIEAFQGSVRANPSFAPARNGLATALALSDRNQEAIENFEVYLKLRPNDGDTRVNYGVVLARLGHSARAEECYRAVIEQTPGLADAHGNLGLMLAKSDRLDEAIAAMNRAVTFDSGSATWRLHLAKYLVRLGNIKEAKSHLQIILKQDPRHAEAAAALGYLNRSQ